VEERGVLADLCLTASYAAQVSEYRDLWHPATGNFNLIVAEILHCGTGGNVESEG
jgi:hypothetical protein